MDNETEGIIMKSMPITIIVAFMLAASISVASPMSAAPPYFTGEEYGVMPDTGQDMTANLQAAINSCEGKGCTLWLKQGVYLFSHLEGKRAACVIGVGAGTPPYHTGTVLQQLPGVNQDGVRYSANNSPTEYMHWTCLKNLQLRGNGGAGHGMKFDSKTGELMDFAGLAVTGFGKDGIRIGEGGSPGRFAEMTVSGNGGCGINVKKNEGSNARVQGITFRDISADNNGLGQICAESIGTLGESIVIDGLKSERSRSGVFWCVVCLKNIFNSGVSVKNVWALTVGPGVEPGLRVVDIGSQWSGSVRMEGIAYQGYDWALTRGSTQIPIDMVREGQGLFYTGNSSNPYWSY